MLEIIVRKAVEKDVPEIVKMIKDFELEHYELVKSRTPELEPVIRLSRDFEGFERKRVSRLLRARNEKVFVAEVDGRLIGYTIFGIRKSPPFMALKRFGRVSQVYVRSEFRRKRVSSKLFQAAREWFKERGVSWINIGVHLENKNALEIYKHWGFVPLHLELWRGL